MHSYIIISNTKSGKEIADSIAPYKIEKSIDNFIINSDENIGIDTIRQIKTFLSKKPYQNSHKIILIHNAHLLTIQAQNSFLKTIEEPPNNTLIIFITKFIDKLLPTVVSRCQILKDESINTPTKIESNQFEDIFHQFNKLNTGEKISLAGQHAYPKSKAISLCKEGVYYFKNLLESNPSQSTNQNLSLTHKTLNRLENNIDPKLSMEHLFIHLEP